MTRCPYCQKTGDCFCASTIAVLNQIRRPRVSMEPPRGDRPASECQGNARPMSANDARRLCFKTAHISRTETKPKGIHRMNPTIIEALRIQRDMLNNELAAVDKAIVLLSPAPDPILFTVLGQPTVAPKDDISTGTVTNGHSNGNGKTSAKELVNLSRPNGTNGRRAPVHAIDTTNVLRTGRGRPSNGQRTMSEQILAALPNKPLTSLQFHESALLVFPKQSKASSYMQLSKAFGDGKLTRTGDRGSYVYRAVRS